MKGNVWQRQAWAAGHGEVGWGNVRR
jgi:hypothetical protein